jgi:chromosome segregation ATPase
MDDVVVEAPTTPPAQPPFPGFTEADLTKARQQEKDKVYSTIEQLKTELASLKAAEAERQQEMQAKAAAEAEAQRVRADAEKDVHTLLKEREEKWKTQFEAERSEREAAFALLERERTFQELEAYRQRALSAADDIMPELRDLVRGNSADEIDASITELRDRSNRIMESVQAATQAARQTPGARVTAPANLENDPAHRTYTPESLKAMNMDDYRANRQRLLGEAAANRGRGIFG